MPDPAERQRTVLRAPRVEFDLSALTLGAVGVLAYQWSWSALAWILSVSDIAGGDHTPGAAAVLRSEFFGRIVGALGLPYGDSVAQHLGWDPILVAPTKTGEHASLYSAGLPAWKLAVAAAWLLVLWSVIGGAIARVYALRIARDESPGASDGVAFSLSNLRSFLLAPLFVAGAAALFFVLASLAAFGSSLPYAGPLLEVVLYPLALVASLVVTVIVAGGVFGFPILQAAIATERNGTLDAISRTFSYVFTRPVAFISSAMIVVAVAGVVSAFGAAFLRFAGHAVEFGTAWNPFGGGDFRADGHAAMATGFIQSARGGLFVPPTLEGADVFTCAWRIVTWLFTSLTALAINGFVLSYFVGGLTDTYFMLRRDVDGIDDSEVYVEEDAPGLSEPMPGEPTSAAKEV